MFFKEISPIFDLTINQFGEGIGWHKQATQTDYSQILAYAFKKY